MLLFSNFLRWFSRILTDFRNFSEIFQFFSEIFQIFSDFFQKFLKNFWKFSEKNLKNFWKFLNPEIFCCQPLKNEGKLAVLLLFSKFSASFSLLLAVPRYQKWRKPSCFAAIFKLFALIFSNFDRSQKFFKNFSEFFQKIFRKFSEISEKFLKIFWKISEKFLNPEIFCCQPLKNEGKLAVLLLFSKFSASFSLLLAVPRYQKWRKPSCFAAIFKLFALIFSDFDRFQNFFRNFSENFQKIFRIFSEISEKFLKIFWKISEKFLNPEIFCCQPLKNEGKLAVLLLFYKFCVDFPRISEIFRFFSEIVASFFSEKNVNKMWKIWI